MCLLCCTRSFAISKTVWSPQASLTNVCDFFSRRCLNKGIKKGVAEPFFQLSVLKYPFFRTFHKLSDTFPHFAQKSWEQFQNPGSSHPSLDDSTKGFFIIKYIDFYVNTTHSPFKIVQKTYFSSKNCFNLPMLTIKR